MLTSTTAADVAAYQEQRRMLDPIAAQLGIDLDAAERDEDWPVLNALHTLAVARNAPAPKPTPAPDPTHPPAAAAGPATAAARADVQQWQAMRSQHQPAQQHQPGAMTAAELAAQDQLGCEVARRILATYGKTPRAMAGAR